ncbi:RibD family protein [Halomonas campisalis]|uniref:RibD family protein n=1 Tax=Billgrantia campisalis TaxID=74661 RepID=A0ABS9P6Y3_9GAMM|nr:RibD family protein [Halomonas campisalis]MCG6657528.1 RibD family protein [Halomonas campisalis]MDR5863125.1 RibD family protein [Halomonas campisalis]
MSATAPDTLESDAAWQWLCRLRDHERPPEDDRLWLDAQGAWQARDAVGDATRELLDCLVPLATHRERLAVAQLGQSLDGRIATQSGHSHYINGLESRTHLHRLRALLDAVVVGAGTVVADDPLLTVRHVPGRQPVRVILDPRGRVPGHVRLLRDAAAPTLHLVGPDTMPATPTGRHVTRLTLPLAGDGFSPAAVLEALAERGLPRVLIEGGGVTVSRFLEAGVLDRLHLLVAPLLIGSGRPGLTLAPIATLDDARRPRARTFRCGDDTLFDLILRNA